MMLRGNQGFGYVRLDWFTPNGLGTWAMGACFILGTDGYNRDPQVHRRRCQAPGQQPLHCRWQAGPLHRLQPDAAAFRSQFVADIVNRTHLAQNLDECLLAAQLVIEAAEQGYALTLHDK